MFKFCVLQHEVSLTHFGQNQIGTVSFWLYLQRAIDMVKFLLRHGNDLLAMDSLRDCDVSLQEQGQLLRQEEFVIWQGRKKSIRRVFLFEELIVMSKPKRNSSGHDIYTYKNSMKMADVGLTENIGGRGLRFEIWFRKLKNRPGDTFTLQASNMEVKESWVRDISKLLWRQAIKNRGRQLFGWFHNNLWYLQYKYDVDSMVYNFDIHSWYVIDAVAAK